MNIFPLLAFRIRTGGSPVVITSDVNPKEVRAERRAEVLGWIGFILIVLGTVAQIGATRPGASPPTSPSCRSCCVNEKAPAAMSDRGELLKKGTQPIPCD
jgi:hypothetical protein